MEEKDLELVKSEVNELINDIKEKKEEMLSNIGKICKKYLNNNIDFGNKLAKYLPETFYYTDIESLNDCIRVELNINNQNYFFAFNQSLYNIILNGKNNIKAKGSMPKNLYSEIYSKIMVEIENIDDFINENGGTFYSIIIKNSNCNKILFGNCGDIIAKNIDNIKLFMMNILNKLIFENDNKK